MKYIHRIMESRFQKLSEEYSCILLTGPRQVGKTTMLQKIMEKEPANRKYLTLDDLNARQLAKNDPAMFFQLNPPPILIDEVQYAPELFSYIKIQIDRGAPPGSFWLTGSQIFKLMKEVQESLAGRIALLHLSSLSQQEIFPSLPPSPFTLDFETLSKKQTSVPAITAPTLYERIFRGGMPALASGKITDSNLYYASYINTYIERDVRDISEITDSLQFMNFITSTAARTSQLVNYASLANDVGISQDTAKRWLGILEVLGIVFFLHPYSNNILKRTIKAPKLYFYDTGLVSYLTKWGSSKTLMAGAMSGALLENYVVSEILKSYSNLGETPYLYYYRDKDGKEIDIVLQKDGLIHPIEIKKTATPDPRLVRVFSVLERSQDELGIGAVICLAETLGAFDSKNYIIPVLLL